MTVHHPVLLNRVLKCINIIDSHPKRVRIQRHQQFAGNYYGICDLIYYLEHLFRQALMSDLQTH